MILEAGYLYIVAGREAEFEAAFAEAAPIIASMKGYHWHQLQRCIEVKGKYLLLVQWETLEDHTTGFRGSPEYQTFRAKLYPFYDPAPTIEHFETAFANPND